jgi:hypothetical protein
VNYNSNTITNTRTIHIQIQCKWNYNLQLQLTIYHIRLIFRRFYLGVTGKETPNADLCFETPDFLKTGAGESWPDLSVGHTDRGNLQAMVGKSVHANTC